MCAASLFHYHRPTPPEATSALPRTRNVCNPGTTGRAGNGRGYCGKGLRRAPATSVHVPDWPWSDNDSLSGDPWACEAHVDGVR